MNFLFNKSWNVRFDGWNNVSNNMGRYIPNIQILPNIKFIMQSKILKRKQNQGIQLHIS